MALTDEKPGVILVADDVEVNRELFRELLESQGHRVVCASDGDGVLPLMRSTPVDAALLDVVMPRRTGFEICREVKSDPDLRLIPVVLVTGLTDREDRIHGLECGADDFLNKPVNREELLARVRSLLRLKRFTDELENAETVLFTLARSIEAKDPYTEGHCERLSHYSVALAERLNQCEEVKIALRRAGTVHDIGKVAVPDHILLKPGPLTPEERKVVEQHTVVGERICAPLKSFKLVLPIIRSHHEKQDGSGYPDGLRGEEVPMTARIMQTVDVFDALTTDRPYRRALPIEEALGVMRAEARRGWWDVGLINEFAALLEAGAEGAGAARARAVLPQAPASLAKQPAS